MADYTITIAVPSAHNVAERWRTQYQHAGRWTDTVHGSSADVYLRLLALGPTPDPRDVNNIIGNTSWTHPDCDVTGSAPVCVVLADHFGREPISLSADLIEAAYAKLQEHRAAFTAGGKM